MRVCVWLLLRARSDPTTLEWVDGVFTGVLRTILNNVRGESKKRHWIVFDGDVDPEWAENLNSVLDDNRLLTLPSGERLSIPDNVRLMFEVHSLRHATLATVSRCGMVWFSDDVVTTDMVLREHFSRLRQGVVGPVVHHSAASAFSVAESSSGSGGAGAGSTAAGVLSPAKDMHTRASSTAGPVDFGQDQLVRVCVRRSCVGWCLGGSTHAYGALCVSALPGVTGRADCCLL